MHIHIFAANSLVVVQHDRREVDWREPPGVEHGNIIAVNPPHLLCTCAHCCAWTTWAVSVEILAICGALDGEYVRAIGFLENPSLGWVVLPGSLHHYAGRLPIILVGEHQAIVRCALDEVGLLSFLVTHNCKCMVRDKMN